MNWSHKVSFPVNICLSTTKSVVEVQKWMTPGVNGEEILDQELPQDDIEGGLCVKIQNKERLLQRMK